MISASYKLLFVLLVLFIGREASAQGKWQVGVLGNYSSLHIADMVFQDPFAPNYVNDVKRTNTGLNLFGSYSFNAHLSAGLNLGYRQLKISSFSPSLSSIGDTANIPMQSAGLFCRIQAPFNKKFGLNTDFQLFYTWANKGTRSDRNGTINAQFYQTALSIIPRFYYTINTHFSLDLNIGRILYTIKEVHINGDDIYNSSNVSWDFDMGVQLGVYYRFGKMN